MNKASRDWSDVPCEPDVPVRMSLVESTHFTLKEGDAFVVLDQYGDCGLVPGGPDGLYFHDTRHLSRFELLVEGQRPLLLGSRIRDDNAVLCVDLTNPDFGPANAPTIAHNLIVLDRTKFLWDGACFERIGIRNYGSRRLEFELEIRFAADFHDLFEVRGATRQAHGKTSVRIATDNRVEYEYSGLDDIRRHTGLTFEPKPGRIEPHRAVFRIALEAGAKTKVLAVVDCGEERRIEPANFRHALLAKRRQLHAIRSSAVTITSSNRLFNRVTARSASDLTMLLTRTEQGLYPYAGIPWFSTVFGRDGIITAMLTLWTNPAVGLGVLRHLAATQATTVDAVADAQPGKILHESRNSEMARLGEVPFGRYYGTIDATPLFVLLAGLYFQRTGDLDTMRSLWGNILAALEWCDRYGDADQDGFVEYHRMTEMGLSNQGWKDSDDAIFHADGSPAEGPIALCEVQSYLYAAKKAIAVVAEHLGHETLAAALRQQADQLRERFETAFWCPEINMYALALDGEKRPCKVRSSNAGHALFCGIATDEHAKATAETMMGADFFSGWGIRTIARGEANFNPISYHNGSIWPHDNALIGAGFARYGLKQYTARILGALVDAAGYWDLQRIPELFCGFRRRPHQGPTAYPVACAPQAWATVAPLSLLASCLGLTMDHLGNEIRFDAPVLPHFLDDVRLGGLKLGTSAMDILVERRNAAISVHVADSSGDESIVVKIRGKR